MADADLCCGFAGSFSARYPELADAILERKVAAIGASGAKVVAMDCPGCLFQIRRGLAAAGLAVRAAHTAEIIASSERGGTDDNSSEEV
jgi:Fe-S oxidoreductase